MKPSITSETFVHFFSFQMWSYTTNASRAQAWRI